MKCPSKKSFCIGLMLFFVGAVSLGGLNTFFHYTNRTDFCVSCHSMKTNFEEYKETVHFKNAAGIQATCADCHVPDEFFPKLYMKVLAGRDVFHEIVGTVDTRDKYESRRWYMANSVWERMRANDSRECRRCHNYDDMDLSAQDRMARKKHARAGLRGKTCIDCHAGIAHMEPDEPDEEESVARLNTASEEKQNNNSLLPLRSMTREGGDG